MEDGGYIKLWRKGEDSRVFKNPDLWKVWTWCLMRANYKERWVEIKTGKSKIEVKVQPGQFIFGRKSAAKALGMPESSVRNRMEKLKKMQNVDIKEDRQYSVVSIVNWDVYQPQDKKEDSEEDRQRTGKGQAKDTDKKDKKDKKDKNKDSSIFSSEANGETAKRFKPPSMEDITAYCQEKNYKVNPEIFHSHYVSNGWMVGKNKLKDWIAAVRGWESRENGGNGKGRPKPKSFSAINQDENIEAARSFLEGRR